MLIRGWSLDRLFENEAEAAGESAAAGAAVAEPVAASDAVAPESSAAAPESDTSAAEPSAEPTYNPLISEEHDKFEAFFDQLEQGETGEDASKTTTSTAMPNSAAEDSVVESDSDAGSSGTEDQREALMVLAEAYDFSRDELKGFTGEQIKRLIAREEKRLAQPGAEQPKADEATATTQPEQRETQPDAADPFEAYAEKRRTQLEAQGFESEYVETEIERDRMLWNSQQQLQTQLLQSEQQRQQERLQHAWEMETQEFDAFLRSEIAPRGFQDLLGTKPFSQLSDTQRQARVKVMQQYQALKQIRPGVPLPNLVKQAFNGVFHDQILHRDRVAQSRKILDHSKRRMASPAPATANDKTAWEGPIESDPVLVRAMQRVKTERLAGAV